jgi:dCTP deaminase
MILGHSEIKRRLLELFPMQRPYKIGAASADVRIGDTLELENGKRYLPFSTASVVKPYMLVPGQRVLVDMLEEVHLPKDLSALFTLKSTRGREGYNHAVAGWVDPGWKGKLTMELKNDNQVRSLALYPGLPIGQLIFMQTIDGGEYQGRYQGAMEVSGAKQEIEYDV